MKGYLLNNALIVTGDRAAKGALSVSGEKIDGIWFADEKGCITFNGESMRLSSFQDLFKTQNPDKEIIDLDGKILMAGGIDAHVHFREPGMTQKADIATESRAALLGGITSFIDMPNTNPPTTSQDRLVQKLTLADGKAFCNYGFHIGATNDNLPELKKLIDDGCGNQFAGIKVFMGSSTGNMLVDRANTLNELFEIKGKEILIHSEDESIIKANMEAAKLIFADKIPFSEHENIRSRTACIRSTARALEMAINKGTALHILHISTAEEVEMIRTAKQYNKTITAETSANYLWFSESDYASLGCKIKCNPSIKAEKDRRYLIEGLNDGTIDTIGSDHAPHLLSEKEQPYLLSPSGIPSIQQSISVVMTVAQKYGIPLTRMALAFSEKISTMLNIQKRGKLQIGYYADMIVIDPDTEFIVGNNQDFKKSGSAAISYKCGWTPYEGIHLNNAIKFVFINGMLAVKNSELISDVPSGKSLIFQ
jgi:dihydroorotase